MNYGLIFIETRNLPGLKEKVYSHLEYLPNDFRPFIYCSEDNKYQFKDFEYRIAPKIESKSDYDYILTNTDFWLMSFNYVVMCQHDSGFLRKGVGEFYSYDYVGAPWTFQTHGGNGGLSFRNVEVMRKLAKSYVYSPRLGHEDVFFCNLMNRLKLNLAPREVCERFSVEAVYNLGSMGYHNIHRWLTDEQCEKILNQYK